MARRSSLLLCAATSARLGRSGHGLSGRRSTNVVLTKDITSLAVLVHAGGADGQQAEAGPALRHARFDHLAAIGDGVADIDRLEPFQIAEAERRAACRRPVRRAPARPRCGGGDNRPSAASRPPRCASRMRRARRNASCAAASSSTWKSCGSKRCAKVLMSSAVKVWRPSSSAVADADLLEDISWRALPASAANHEGGAQRGQHGVGVVEHFEANV